MGYKDRKPFAAQIALNPETLGGYERGDTFPSEQFLERYNSEFSVNLNWLISGAGSMFQGQQESQSIRSGPDYDRLELAIETIERGLADAGKVATPPVKAGLTIAAYELLEEPSERAVTNVLRLVKG